MLCRQQVIEEWDGSDNWVAEYVYEDGIDRPRAMDRADIADVDGDSNTTEILRFHYHQNVLSSTSEMSEPGGAVVEWVTYDVYGAATIRDKVGTVVTQSAVGNPFLYTGREYDSESGKYFYRARTYDPSAGRFLQRDPLGYVDGMSLYEYARSAALVYVDPLGRFSIWDLTPAGPAMEKAKEEFKKLPEKTQKEALKKAGEFAGYGRGLNDSAGLPNSGMDHIGDELEKALDNIDPALGEAMRAAREAGALHGMIASLATMIGPKGWLIAAKMLGNLKALFGNLWGLLPKFKMWGDDVLKWGDDCPRISAAGGGGAAKRPPKPYLTKERKGHILDGDKAGKGGGHRPGTGKPGKSEFPDGWDDKKILDSIEDVASNPNSKVVPAGGDRVAVKGTRDGVDIEVILDPDGKIVTGYPTNVPRNP